jgi:hypothetical protein
LNVLIKLAGAIDVLWCATASAHTFNIDGLAEVRSSSSSSVLRRTAAATAAGATLAIEYW